MQRDESWSKYQETAEDSRKYHDRYLIAVNNPIRRKILYALMDGEKTIDEIVKITSLPRDVLAWHLKILEWGFCIKQVTKENDVFLQLQKEGEIVNFLKSQ